MKGLIINFINPFIYEEYGNQSKRNKEIWFKIVILKLYFFCNIHTEYI